MKFKDLLKKSISYPIMFTILSIIWQLVFRQSVDLFESIGIGILVFLFNLLYEWSKTPYKWKNKNHS